MATNNWSVEDALDEVVRAIQDGSSLSITGLEDGYKRRYRRDFQEHWDKNDYSWPDARETILPLAEMVGSLATTLSIYRAVEKGTPVPRTVDQFSAYMAGYLVAKGLCPPGVWCMYYYYMEPSSGVPTTNPDTSAIKFREFLLELGQILSPAQPTSGSR
jgi:hypothetical protein